MRILQIHTTYRQAGGEDTVVAQEAAALTAAGHDVVTHTVANPTTPVATAATLLRSPWNTTAAADIASAATAAAPDVVHVHNTWFALSPAIFRALHRASLPTVMTLHNYRLVCANAMLFRDGQPCQTCVGATPWHGVAHRCYHDSAVASTAVASTIALHRAVGTWQHHVNRFLVFNEFARDVFARGGVPPDKMTIKPNFTADPGPRVATPSAGTTVLVVGRVEQVKGIDVLIAAWQAARPHGLELVVVGDGDLRTELEQRALPGIRFVGSLPADEVRQLMLSARAVAFPSLLYEGQPMVIVEAFSAGTPVLASARGGNREVVGQLGDGWLAEAGDVAGWTRALDALSDDEHVDRGGAIARSIYTQRYSEKVGITLLDEAYRMAINDGGPR